MDDLLNASLGYATLRQGERHVERASVALNPVHAVDTGAHGSRTSGGKSSFPQKSSYCVCVTSTGRLIFNLLITWTSARLLLIFLPSTTLSGLAVRVARACRVPKALRITAQAQWQGLRFHRGKVAVHLLTRYQAMTSCCSLEYLSI